jgi:hypothetical protein
MTKGLVRYQQCGCFHFVTFSCHRRLPYLGMESGRWPGHEITKNRCAPFIHSFIVDEWESKKLNSPSFLQE